MVIHIVSSVLWNHYAHMCICKRLVFKHTYITLLFSSIDRFLEYYIAQILMFFLGRFFATYAINVGFQFTVEVEMDELVSQPKKKLYQ